MMTSFPLADAGRFGVWFLEFYVDQANWSEKTFGPDSVRGPAGPLKHMAKEVEECLRDPKNIEEYADLLLLWVDATRRAGFTPFQMIQAARAKLSKCKEREWPKPSADEPVEHVRNKETTAGIVGDGQGPRFTEKEVVPAALTPMDQISVHQLFNPNTTTVLSAAMEETLEREVQKMSQSLQRQLKQPSETNYDLIWKVMEDALGAPEGTIAKYAATLHKITPEETQAMKSRQAWGQALGVDVETGKPLKQPKVPEPEPITWHTPHPKGKDVSSSPIGVWNLVTELQTWASETLPDNEAEELQVSWLATVKDDSIMMGNLRIWSLEDGFTVLDEDARTEEGFDRFRTLNLDNCIKEFRAQLVASNVRIKTIMNALIKKA